MSDTPETDKAERMAFSSEYMVPTEFARKLERERDEARGVLQEIANASHFDNIGNWARNKARQALEEIK